MRASEIVRKVVDEKGCVLIRHREPVTAPFEYDVKGPFVGRKKGWVLVDLFTASAVLSVLNALSDQNKEKFDSIPFQKLVEFTWKQVR